MREESEEEISVSVVDYGEGMDSKDVKGSHYTVTLSRQC